MEVGLRHVYTLALYRLSLAMSLPRADAPQMPRDAARVISIDSIRDNGKIQTVSGIVVE